MSLVIKSEENVFKTKFSIAGSFIMILLGIAILALTERVLYDVARLFAPAPVDYFSNLSVIMVQAFFIVLFLVVALFVNMATSGRKEKYAVALAPYFVVSIFLALQLALQVSVYFYNHHTDFEFYVVMLVLVFISTFCMYLVQKKYNPES